MDLILASASPRRQELLKLIAEDFEIVVSDVDESLPPDIAPDAAVEQLALRKARAVAGLRPDAAIIGADTVVAVGKEILGKPKDAADARAMLEKLSGTRHMVYTGVAVVTPDKTVSFSEGTAVFFHELDENTIRNYIASGEPFDKAGGYGIQEKAALFIPRIEGDYYNVMGLPVCRLGQILRNIAITD